MHNQLASATVPVSSASDERVLALEEELAKVRSELERAERQAKNFQQAYAEAEAQSELVTSLYVALQRLYGNIEREFVLTALQEIVVNLIGCEELVIYGADKETKRLCPERVFGIRAHRIDEITVGEGMLGQEFAKQKIFVKADEGVDASDPRPEVFVPLLHEGHPIGAIALLRFLPHKAGIDDRDRELLMLLEIHAANTLALTA